MHISINLLIFLKAVWSAISALKGVKKAFWWKHKQVKEDENILQVALNDSLLPSGKGSKGSCIVSKTSTYHKQNHLYAPPWVKLYYMQLWKTTLWLHLDFCL